jgi:hypothetical protein
MDLKNDFEDIIKEYGHTVYLQRRKEAHESGPYREIEGGRYEPTAETWTSYRWFAGGTRRSGEDLIFEGISVDVSAIFYLQATAAPKYGDLIAEPTLGSTLVYFAALCDRISPVV